MVWVLHCPFMSGLYKTAKEYKPSNLAIAPNGDIYVADGYGKFYIHHYDSKTRYVRSFGGSRELMDKDPTRETAPGTTIWPHAIAIDTRGLSLFNFDLKSFNLIWCNIIIIDVISLILI